VNAQTLGDGQHDLPMGDRRADFLGNVQRGQQRPLLVAGGTRARNVSSINAVHRWNNALKGTSSQSPVRTS